MLHIRPGRPLVCRFALLVAFSGALVGVARAREFWLEPVRFWVQPGQRVHIRRLIGSHFQGDVWAGKRNRLTGFWHHAPGQSSVDLLSATAPADTLASTITLQQPGTHLVTLTTDNAFTTLPAAEFTTYLQQEDFGFILAQRQQRGDSAKPGREAYRRCAKTLVQAGPVLPTDTARAWARVLNLPLELVPEQNPYTLMPGAAFTVRVLRYGHPVAGQQVALWQRAHQPQALISKLRSNQNGRVLFRLSEAGEYLASTVRMEPAPAGVSADWQSTWSTLSFGLAGKKRL
ncbi:DUF4198 domain-containing protein [Hymenobacter rigui]|uniref:DUF4198 domain-containing protein n=1 Tax=Hymenobacter rigui TaxID=334424 RepID=A0A3R9PY72_9BACT|nr:DUF4198 domain-containing protein [Hymenobacter rigui]RSK48750.1 DUF4198 domain-containing protein [Hymenobacter rigui]